MTPQAPPQRTRAEETTHRQMHRRNHVAYEQGRAAAGTRASNPYPLGNDGSVNDQRYWWNEGFHGRPFDTLTDTTALRHFARDRQTRRRSPEGNAP